jgi:hypothetical protein
MALGNALFNLVGRTTSGNSGLTDAISGGMDRLAKSAGTALGSISSLTEALTNLLMAPLNNIKSLATTIAPLIAAFNPAIVTRFGLALHDTNAVLGSVLIPILEGSTTFVRKFGDTLAGFGPVISPLTEKIGQFIANFGTSFTSMLHAAAPVVQALGDGIGWLLDKITIGIGMFSGAVTELINQIMSLVGATSRFDPNARSTGFGTRNVRVGSVEQVANEAFASSARNSFNRESGIKSPEEASEALRKAFDQGRTAMADLTGVLREIYVWASRNFGDMARARAEGQALDAVGRNVGGAKGASDDIEQVVADLVGQAMRGAIFGGSRTWR